MRRKRNSKSGFLANILTLFGGRSTEAAIGIACMPIITRFFEPIDYGIAVALISITNIMMPLATLTFERAIVLTKTVEEEAGLCILSFLSAICFAIILGVANYYDVFDGFYKTNPDLMDWLWVIPIYIVIRSLSVIYEQVAIKKTVYKRLAIAGVFSICFAMTLRIYGGYTLGSNVFILVAAYVLGMFVRITISSIGLLKIRDWVRATFNIKELFIIAKYYSEFPKYQVWGSLLRALANNLPVIALAIIYTPAIAGVYAMAIATTRRPLEALLASYRSVFLQHGALLQGNPQELLVFFRKHTLYIFFIGVIPFTALFFFAPKAFPIILGGNWQQVGEFVAIISIWLFTLFLSMPAVATFVIIKKQRIWLRFTIFNALMQLTPLLIAQYYRLDIFQVLWGYSGLGAIANILMILKTHRIIRKLHYA